LKSDHSVEHLIGETALGQFPDWEPIPDDDAPGGAGEPAAAAAGGDTEPAGKPAGPSKSATKKAPTKDEE
jgi:hypothetical protein